MWSKRVDAQRGSRLVYVVQEGGCSEKIQAGPCGMLQSDLGLRMDLED